MKRKGGQLAEHPQNGQRTMVRALPDISKRRGLKRLDLTLYRGYPPVPPPTPRQELAAAAYAHACAVLGQSDVATEAAVLAVHRGGRSLATVLGHARDASLTHEADAAAVDEDAAAPTDLDELAGQLAFLRPATERAIIDLEGRYGLDSAGLGQALGLNAAAAAARAGDVAAEWQRTLDPVLLARLGAGSCSELAEILGPPAPEAAETADGEAPADGQVTTLGDLLRAGGRAGAHAETCDVCRDRLRAMVSVRTLLARRPLPDPPSAVTEAAAVAKLRASAAPPPLERVRSAARRRLPVLAAVALVVIGAVAAGAFVGGDDDERPSQVEAMTKVPAASNGLAVRPTVVEGDPSPTVRLRNLRNSETTWNATADHPWVLVEPATGTLAAAESASVVVTFATDAPEGDVVAAITFTADDGSTAVTRVKSNVARDPDIAAERSGCQVIATIEDDSALASVVLHQKAADSIHMREGDAEGSWVATLAGTGGDWWVTATDALGNEGRTSDQPLPDGC